MNPSWVRTVEPTKDPVTVAEVKQHARITQTNDDASVLRFIKVATGTAEDYMSRGLLTQTWKLVLDEFSNEIYLPMAAPLQNDAGASPSTAVIVQYYDTSGVLQVLATSVYDVDTTSRPGRIVLAYNQVWPALVGVRRAGRVVITYVVGWTSADLIPERIKQGIRMYVAYLDADREGFEEGGTRARQAAEACWDDRVRYIEPLCTVNWDLHARR